MYMNKNYPREQKCPKCGENAFLGYFSVRESDKPVYICRHCGTWSKLIENKDDTSR